MSKRQTLLDSFISANHQSTTSSGASLSGLLRKEEAKLRRESALLKNKRLFSSTSDSKQPDEKSRHEYATDSFGNCPICQRSVPLYRINDHIDSGDCTKQEITAALPKYPQGLKIIPEFISKDVGIFNIVSVNFADQLFVEEEKSILDQISKDPSWTTTYTNGQRLSLFYGCGIDLLNRYGSRSDLHFQHTISFHVNI